MKIIFGKLWIKASDLFPPVSISAPTQPGSDSPGKIELVFRVCITLITVLWLAFAVRNSLSYLFGHSEEGHATFRLQAIGNQDFGSTNQRRDLLVLVQDRATFAFKLPWVPSL